MKHHITFRYITALISLICIQFAAYAQDEPAEDSILLDKIFEYSLKGYENNQYSINLDTAEYYLTKALNLQYTARNYKIDDRVAINHNSLGS
ncbi:MAG: hypothetical protein ABFS38_11690, partial [Bacteroidota bacterium]